MLPDFVNLTDEDVQLMAMLRRLHLYVMPMVEKVTATAPTVDTLPEGFFQRFDDGTNRRIFHNLNGVIYYWGLTAA